MKQYHFILLFIMFALAMCTICLMNLREYQNNQTTGSKLDYAIDRASEAAASIITEGGVTGIEGIRDRAVDCFFESVAANMGQTGVPGFIDNFKLYVPVIAIADSESIYVYYSDFIETEDGRSGLYNVWSEKITREYDALEDLFVYYCTQHNRVASEYGIDYYFGFSEEEGKSFIRSCKGSGIYILVQGYPVNGLSGRMYSRIAFGGTGINLKKQFYVNIVPDGAEEGRKYFHKYGCEELGEITEAYPSKKEAAMHGAYECSKCMGGGN